MKEGYWINYATGSVRMVDDHENWIRRPRNAKEIDVSPPVLSAACARHAPRVDREAFLLYLMEKASLIRVRGHLTHVTFEYVADDDTAPLAAIRRFAADNIGDQMVLHVVNFGNKTTRTVQVRELLEEAP